MFSRLGCGNRNLAVHHGRSGDGNSFNHRVRQKFVKIALCLAMELFSPFLRRRGIGAENANQFGIIQGLHTFGSVKLWDI